MTRVDVKPAQGMFNFRCHENTVEWIRLHPGHTLVEVIYLDDDQPILHYVARSPEGKLLEVTLGWRATELEYYVMRDIRDPSRVYKEFNASMAYWLDVSTTRLARLAGLERVVETSSQ